MEEVEASVVVEVVVADCDPLVVSELVGAVVYELV